MLILKRDPLRSSGAAIRMFSKTMQPISGLYPADPTSMAVKKNDFGRPVQWKQELWDSEKEKKVARHRLVVAQRNWEAWGLEKGGVPTKHVTVTAGNG